MNSIAETLGDKRFYPLDEAIMEDPYDEYARVRELGPVCWMAPSSFGVTRYDDIGKLIKDKRIVSSFPKDDSRFTLDSGPASELSQQILLTRETRDHQRLRNLIAPTFTPRRVAAIKECIAGKVSTIYNHARDKGQFDAMVDLALPLTIAVVSEVLGIPESDRDEIGRRASELSRAFTPFAMDIRQRESAKESLIWLRQLLRELLLERVKNPKEDLLGQMAIALQQSDQFSEDELVDNAVFVVFTGYETTSSLIGTGFSLLLEHEEERCKLWDDKGLIKSCIQEMLRFDAPSQYAAGIVREQIEYYGHVFRPRRVVFFMLGSGNRDPRKFKNPDQFYIARGNSNLHLSFGVGPHRCVGAALGLMECEIVLEQLIDTFKDINPAGNCVRHPNPSIRSYYKVPVSVTSR